MGKVTGFKEYPRETPERRPVPERVKDFFEVYQPFPHEKVRTQAARCMDCGIPFCHTGCPVNNIIPDWNDLVYNGRWKDAIRTLHATNNFPEFTGRICPAPCEAACVLGINETPVAIKQIEKSIVERAFSEGWIEPEPPMERTGQRIAIVGSGPAGLAAAQQLNRAGHWVTVFEKSDRIGGLLRYGIPDFKLEKPVVDRRLEQMMAEGVRFEIRAHVGQNVPVEDLRRDFDGLLLANGAEQPRDLKVPGREYQGIHFAMEFLPQQNQVNAGDRVENQILATGKNVVIIGGGDTGADCLGTSHRQRPKCVQQLEIMPMPPAERSPSTPWPLWPLQLRTESSHEEGGIRNWSIVTTHFTADSNGNVRLLHAVRVGPPPKFESMPGTEFTIEAELVLLAMGFLGPVRPGVIERLGLKLDPRGNIATDDNCMSSVPGVFAAGDARRGQSLVVWAIQEGRRAAQAIDLYCRERLYQESSSSLARPA
ncbi:MAG: glutamate synthase subunit beta [Terriglobia bacterium]